MGRGPKSEKSVTYYLNGGPYLGMSLSMIFPYSMCLAESNFVINPTKNTASNINVYDKSLFLTTFSKLF
jgi:hypothetical protein